MKLNNVFSKEEFAKIKAYFSKWESDKDYSDDDIDVFDKELDNLNQKLGYEKEKVNLFFTSLNLCKK